MPPTRKQEQEPASAEVVEVGPSVLRMQLPISMPGLGHLNSYALLDDRGAAVVDTGVPGPATWKALQARLKQAGLKRRDIHTVLVTHSHPDHFGTAGRLAKECGAELVTHSAFRTWWAAEPCDHAAHEVADVDPTEIPSANPWRDRAPWGSDRFKPPLRRRISFQLTRSGLLGAYTPPCPSRRLRDGEAIKLAGREWFAVHTPGHTLDHLCLHDPEGGLLLSGDHVLPTITPHISGLGGGRDPLAHFFASLDRVAALENVVTTLPAHGQPLKNLAARTEDIKVHHQGRLDRLVDAGRAEGPLTVTELSRHLFRPARWGFMAESETYAHLEHLRLSGRAHRRDTDGTVVYEMT